MSDADWGLLDEMDTDYDYRMPVKNKHEHFIEKVEMNELSKDEIVEYLKEHLK